MNCVEHNFQYLQFFMSICNELIIKFVYNKPIHICTIHLSFKIWLHLIQPLLQRSSALDLSKICESKYWFATMLFSLLQNCILTFIWHFCSREFKLNDKKRMAMNWPTSIIQICNKKQFHLVSCICILFSQ